MRSWRSVRERGAVRVGGEGGWREDVDLVRWLVGGEGIESIKGKSREAEVEGHLRFVAVVLGEGIDVCVGGLLKGEAAIFECANDLAAGFGGD